LGGFFFESYTSFQLPTQRTTHTSIALLVRAGGVAVQKGGGRGEAGEKRYNIKRGKKSPTPPSRCQEQHVSLLAVWDISSLNLHSCAFLHRVSVAQKSEVHVERVLAQ
jgi:hypothetical protein